MLLLEDIAVPVQDDLPFVSREPQGKGRHRVWVMDMDDVVAVADTSEAEDHLGRNHRRSRLDQRIGTHDAGALREDYIVHLAVVGGTEHVAGVASLIETLCEDHHDLLYAAMDGVKLTKL